MPMPLDRRLCRADLLSQAGCRQGDGKGREGFDEGKGEGGGRECIAPLKAPSAAHASQGTPCIATLRSPPAPTPPRPSPDMNVCSTMEPPLCFAWTPKSKRDCSSLRLVDSPESTSWTPRQTGCSGQGLLVEILAVNDE